MLEFVKRRTPLLYSLNCSSENHRAYLNSYKNVDFMYES